MKAKKFFFMFTQKQPEKFNFSDMIFVRQKNLFQGFAPTGPARFSSHHNKSAETPRGPQKVDQKVTYLAGEENEMEFET